MEKQHESKQHTTETKHETETTSQGLGLGLGVDITLELGALRSGIDMLTDALRQTGETTTDLFADAIRKIREAGPEQLKKAAEEGQGEAKDTYNTLVSKLQDAAGRGEEEARNMLRTLGENVEGAGEKMQDVAEKDVGESTH
jgi:hypothetical protein